MIIFCGITCNQSLRGTVIIIGLETAKNKKRDTSWLLFTILAQGFFTDKKFQAINRTKNCNIITISVCHDQPRDIGINGTYNKSQIKINTSMFSMFYLALSLKTFLTYTFRLIYTTRRALITLLGKQNIDGSKRFPYISYIF